MLIDARRALNDCLRMSGRTGVRISIWLLLAAVIFPALAEEPFTFDDTPGQLPKTVVPHHYALRLEPDFEKFTTRGSVLIDIEVRKPVKEILLNALEIKFTKATLLGQREIALKVKINDDKQSVRLKLPHELAPGNYQLALEFAGQIGEQAQGLFYVKYSTPSGKKVMLGTQMEPTDARRMFPCWDEPVFRATFDLTVSLPEKLSAISNMPAERETRLADGQKEIKFARTPPMASYLVLLVAGEFSELRDEVDGVKIRVVTTEGKQEQGRYALEATKKLLAYYDDYFGIIYPLPKLDQIAIPGGFNGAMENWGGITYNESVLLFDPKTSSQQTQRDVFVTVAHEMAHQWFGDLVTTAWWDNLWLNEGFATWMETKVTDHFNPEWEMWLTASSEKSAVMSSDAHRPTHAIQQPVRNESEADDAFDGITYQKGGAFLRMLEDYLGEAVFRQGIHNYLSAHLYSSATTADLWVALEQVSGKPIRAISAGWTQQPGVPVVQLETLCTDGKLAVSLKQERLTVPHSEAGQMQWKIPVTLLDAAHSNQVTQLLLKDKSASQTFPDCAAILKANAGDMGYYRVQYAPPVFEKLRLAVHGLPVADRLNLLNDSWAMVEAGRDAATNYLALAESLRDEKTAALWDEILGTLNLIDDLEQKQPGHAAFQKYACRLLQPQFQRLGWERISNEPVNDALLRTKIIAASGHFGDQAVIAEAKARFANFLAQPGTLSPDLRPAVLNIAGRFSDQTI
ncbi:MAG: pepN, partial [Pedosphaera sp.]|nr:pepN [Pedosphaera sp.]